MNHKMVLHELGPGHDFWAGRLPEFFILDGEEFTSLWNLHPKEYHEIRVPGGKLVKTPRWQQAYGKDYAFTGRVSKALPLDTLTGPVPKVGRIVAWCRGACFLTGTMVPLATTLESTTIAPRAWSSAPP